MKTPLFTASMFMQIMALWLSPHQKFCIIPAINTISGKKIYEFNTHLIQGFFLRGDLRVCSLRFSLYEDTKKIEQESWHQYFPKGAWHSSPGDDAKLFYLVEPKSAALAGRGRGRCVRRGSTWALLVEWATSFPIAKWFLTIPSHLLGKETRAKVDAVLIQHACSV